MQTDLFFLQQESAPGGEQNCTLAAIVNGLFFWKISWKCDAAGNRITERHLIESGTVADSGESLRKSAMPIDEAEIPKCPGADPAFIKWALSGYRSYLVRTVSWLLPEKKNTR